jgi:hypothetical protein
VGETTSVHVLSPMTLNSNSVYTTTSTQSGPLTRMDPEEVWNAHMSNLHPDHPIFLTEELFCRIWNTKGKQSAMELLENGTLHDLPQLAGAHFHRGCQLWAQDDFSLALEELLTSKSYWESYDPHLLILMQNLSLPQTTKATSSIRSKTSNLPAYTRQAVDTDDIIRRSTSSDSNRKHHIVSIAQLYYAIGTVQLSLKNPRPAIVAGGCPWIGT